MTNLESFWYWINERHSIYLNRQDGMKWPWTKDHILQKFRFCNVFRELDTVTIWIRENWREPYADHPNLWFAMCVARQINRPETLKKLGFPKGNLNDYVTKCRGILQGMKDGEEQIYGAAYILTAGGKPIPKHIYTLDHILKPIARHPPDFATYPKATYRLQAMWNQLRQYEGFGPFIAYEVVTDLRWTRYYNGKDHLSWANTGPGAKRGLARIYYGDISKKMKEDEYLRKMRELLETSKTGVLKNYVPELELRDIEHSLCETDKYLRAKTGEGRPKAKYHGRGP